MGLMEGLEVNILRPFLLFRIVFSVGFQVIQFYFLLSVMKFCLAYPRIGTRANESVKKLTSFLVHNKNSNFMKVGLSSG